MIDALKDLPLRWFDAPEFLTHLERYQSSVNITWIALSVVSLAGSTGAVISLAVLATRVSLPIFLIVVSLGLLYVLLSSRLSWREFTHWRNESESRKRLEYYRQTLTAAWVAKDLRVLSASNYFLEKWRKESEAALDRAAAHQREQARRWDKVRILGFFVQAVLIVGSCILLAMGWIRVGQLLLLITLSLSLPQVLGDFARNLVQPLVYLRANQDFKRFYDKDWQRALPDMNICDIATDPVIKPASGAQPSTASIAPKDPPVIFSLKGVGYQYNDKSWALRDIHLDIQEGEIVALVGHNGAGKSTLTKLLLGFYQPTEGMMYYRGSQYCPEVVEKIARETGASFQDFFRFEMKLRENVAFGHLPSMDNDAALVSAMQQAGADCLLEKANGDLDRYFGTWYSDDGIGFSGGESQRLSASRVFVTPRPILVMDEPASMLDPIAEVRQFDAIRSTLGSRTAILVSHRIGFARLANKIAVLSGGRLVEYGTHEELINKKGEYYHMYYEQAQWYREDLEDVGV